MTKEDILHHFQDINFYYNDCMMYDDLSRMLDELIAENKGEWITDDLLSTSYEHVWECSKCHAPCRVMYNFCPKCGADMRGE